MFVVVGNVHRTEFKLKLWKLRTESFHWNSRNKFVVGLENQIKITANDMVSEKLYEARRVLAYDSHTKCKYQIPPLN